MKGDAVARILAGGVAIAVWAGASSVAAGAFELGVAAADVRSTSAVLWTRASAAGPVTLELAGADATRTIAARAAPDRDLTVSVRVDGLRPATAYRYRFNQTGAASVAGTFRTAPGERDPRAITLVYSGDADGTPDPRDGTPRFGPFPVLWRAAAERPDLFVFLGDTVYVDAAGLPPARTLDAIRARHRLNRRIPSLRSLQRRVPLVAIWDDHEIANDWNPSSVDAAQLAAGTRAFREYLPIDAPRAGPLYRSFRWGRHVELFVLDPRSFRSPTAESRCANPPGGSVPDVLPTGSSTARAILGRVVPQLRRPVRAACLRAIRDGGRTLLGPTQVAWLLRGLASSTATWKLVLTTVPIQEFGLLPYDRWEGYAGERGQVLRAIARRGVENVVWLAADAHATFYQELRLDGRPTGMAELVVGPIGASTLGSVIDSLAGPLGVLAARTYIASQGSRCIELDTQSYGVATASATRLVLDARDAQGRSLCGGPIELRAR